MKRLSLSGILFLLSMPLFAQLYSATKAGLSLREQPSVSAKVLDKIPYGEKLVTSTDPGEQVALSTEGFNGYWLKVNYKNKTGFVAAAYTLPAPPPKEGINSMKDYLAQVSSATGSPMVIKKKDAAMAEMGEATLTKQWFKNGMEYHRTEGYENASELFILPGFSIEQCFLLLRLLNSYPGLIGEKDPFPVKNSVIKNPNGNKTIKRMNYDGMEKGMVEKLSFYMEEGAVTELQIFLLDTQAVIFWTSGV